MNGQLGSRWRALLEIFVSLLLLAGCAAPPPLYLQPGRGLANPAMSNRPLVQLEPFAEDFGTEKIVGGHFFQAQRQELRVKDKEIATTLRRMIAQQLAKRHIPFTYGEQWNGTISGLDRIEPPVRLVVDGGISRVWLEVKSGITYSDYSIGMDVSCRQGIVPEQKVVSRTVHISEDMIKFSSQPEEMEKMLDQSLAEAARQIATTIAEKVGMGAGS